MLNSIKSWSKDNNFIQAIFVFACLILASSLHAQTSSVKIEQDSLKYEEFEMAEGDTTYVMKKYFLLTYLTGEHRDQPEDEANEIQKQHMAHMEALSTAKKICIAGPFGHDGKERGIIIFNTYTLEEAETLAKQDPAVIAGRLSYTLHPIWLAKGSALF